MLALLKHACTPYLIFVQEWVYHGVYIDAYREFLTQVNDDYLQFKDKHYWTHGYTLATDLIDDSVHLCVWQVHQPAQGLQQTGLSRESYPVSNERPQPATQLSR
ncbi:gamma-tubulin complex component 6-like isoform X2 [Dreissena polymorpha]|uniref:gamma-tubulin complex component 6-like isoform X2 n=1 Tax=Dreissena polymorpha TaxID=45954 RepID=UPI0022649E1F|nr:gamma-tubulin complex component 6-like isoform X2 [Dreissena polymorpha]